MINFTQYNIQDGIVLGIDAALSNFGVSIFEIDTNTSSYDLIDLKLNKTSRTKTQYKNFNDLQRCQEIHFFIKDIIEKYNPQCIFAELPQVGGKQMQADSMVYAGAMMGILSSFDIPIYFFPTKEIKDTVLGYVTPDKNVMIEHMVALYPNAPWKRRKLKGEMVLTADNEHLADAAASVECAFTTSQTSFMCLNPKK